VIPIAPVATAFTFTGPISGNVNSSSANFTVTPNNPYTGSITITPSGAGSTGLSASVLTFSNSSASQTFSITPTVAGSITLTPTNNGSLTNPATLYYTANVVSKVSNKSIIDATAGNASASVSFPAPKSYPNSSITGYYITSYPAGGIDINAGSTLQAHIITGLTNGVSYTFTVKATYANGKSVNSPHSNSVIPTASLSDFSLASIKSGNLNSGTTDYTDTFDNSLWTSEENIQELFDITVFPNPCRDNLTVRFSEMPDAGSHIEIMDISGRKVESREIMSTNERFSLGQQPAGLYLVKTVIGSKEVINKLILNK
jgi:hypothetical protein